MWSREPEHVVPRALVPEDPARMQPPPPKHASALGVREVVAWAMAAFFVGSAIIGMVRGYSAVPFWDMWNGYLDFYVKSSQGGWQVWWAQHNEHRIVLSRLLFWLDLAWFRGEGWFLLAVNALLLAVIAALFVVMWREESGGRAGFVPGLLVAWLWSWINHENLAWGFQSQFFLVLLLPLAGLYALTRSRPAAGWRDSAFAAACTAGLLAVGSMANGILALPALAIHAALARLGRDRFMILCLLAATCCAAYFRGYVSPGHHESATAAVSANPLGAIVFTLLYLGSPFFFIAERFGVGMAAGCLCGGLLLVASAWTALRALRAGGSGSLPLALMVFNGYVFTSAFATAAGRVSFGPQAAVTSRYTLAALMAWAALLVANARPLTRSGEWVSRGLAVTCFGIIIGLLPLQVEALRSRRQEMFGREVAALALELGVNDDQEIKRVWHDSRVALEHVVIPRANDLSIFGWEPIRDAGDEIGQPFAVAGTATLRERHGRLDSVERIWHDPRFLRLRGTYSIPAGESPSRALTVVRSGVVVGLALVQDPAADEAAGSPLEAAFVGYVLQEVAGDGVEIVDAQSGARFSALIPRLNAWCDVEDAGAADVTTVAASAVLPQAGQWAGSDFERTRIPRLVVLGSYDKGDADTGGIALRLRRGDRLAYKTGPNPGRQTISMRGAPESKTALPLATAWRQIRFEGGELPAEFTVEIADEGDGWGEWSAVALVETVTGE